MNKHFAFNTARGLTVLKDKNIATCHGFTTVLGGIGEQKEFRGLNLGINSIDKRENILTNYHLLCDAMGIDIHKIAVLNQIHSGKVFCVRDDQMTDGICDFHKRLDGDGMITDCAGVTLMVFYADCVPVLLYDPVKRVAGAVHSGWRGTVKGIATKAAKTMRHEYGCENIVCAIGPSIGKCHFETGLAVYEEFERKFGNDSKKWSQVRNEKAYISMQECIRENLLDAGVKQVDVADECTVCNNDCYYSHRCGDLGRMVGFIQIS